MFFTDAEVWQDKNAMNGSKNAFPHIPQQTKWNFLGGSTTVQLPLTNQRKRACFIAFVTSDLPKMRNQEIILNIILNRKS